MHTVAYVGIDVDDMAFPIGIVNQNGFEIRQFAVKPIVSHLIKKLKSKASDYDLVCDYEAIYTGYTLQRDLREYSIECRVIVPTSIPRSPNERVKSDRINAL